MPEIPDYPEETDPQPTDYLVVETAAGTRKIALADVVPDNPAIGNIVIGRYADHSVTGFTFGSRNGPYGGLIFSDITP